MECDSGGPTTSSGPYDHDLPRPATFRDARLLLQRAVDKKETYGGVKEGVGGDVKEKTVRVSSVSGARPSVPWGGRRASP